VPDQTFQMALTGPPVKVSFTGEGAWSMLCHGGCFFVGEGGRSWPSLFVLYSLIGERFNLYVALNNRNGMLN
jgi:hypothetical protein